ncbi:hypothetical protein [Vibrio thalassae]|uniref:hypothetical protein n=1 Tax=Vibrio thalassae TaxID=1243014 RepID=UPI001305123E|nr:hypothetical protein [Vibrio thalassae]
MMSVESLAATYNILINIISLSISIVVLFKVLGEPRLKSLFLQSIQLVLIVHVTVFFLQFFVVYLTDYYIDFVHFFSGQNSRYLSYVKVGLIGMYRPTGLLVEPSTYFGVVFCLYMALKCSTYKIKRYIEYAVIASFLLTFSSVAYVVLVIYFVSRFNKLGIVTNAIIVLFFSILSVMYFSEITPHIEKIVNSSQIRIALVDYLINRDIDLLLLGPSMFGIEQQLYDLASGNISSATHYNRVASINDVGTLVFLMVKLGMTGILLYMVMLFLSLKNSKATYFFSVTLIKLSIMNPIFVMLLPLYFIKDNET